MTTDASLYCSHAHGCDGKATARPQTACDSPPAPKRPASTCARSRSPQTRTTLKGVGGKAAVEPMQPQRHAYRVCTAAAAAAAAPAAAPVASRIAPPLLPSLPPPLQACTRDGPRPATQHAHVEVADARPGACPMSRRSGAREVGRDDESGATVAAFTCHHHASESELH